MNKQDHLMLRLIRLKPAEDFPINEDGLSFVFAKGGTGKCAARTASQRLLPGDIHGSERNFRR